MNLRHNFLYRLIVITFAFLLFFVTTNGIEVENKENLNDANVLANPSNRLSNGKSIKDISHNMAEKGRKSDDKNKESIRKEHEMYNVLRLHQINNDFNKELKTDAEKKEKGKLQSVGGVVGEIIAVIVSEVVKLFGNMVSDVAREVTAHGFVSIFKQFTDLTGITLPEI